MPADETNETTPDSVIGSPFVDVLLAIASIVGSMGLSFLAAFILLQVLEWFGSDETLATEFAVILLMLGNATAMTYFGRVIPWTTGRFVKAHRSRRHRCGIRVGTILVLSFLAIGFSKDILVGNVQGDLPTKVIGLSIVVLWVLGVGWDFGRRAAETEWEKRSEQSTESVH